jgi:hypothetical protein
LLKAFLNRCVKIFGLGQEIFLRLCLLDLDLGTNEYNFCMTRPMFAKQTRKDNVFTTSYLVINIDGIESSAWRRTRLLKRAITSDDTDKSNF